MLISIELIFTFLDSIAISFNFILLVSPIKKFERFKNIKLDVIDDSLFLASSFDHPKIPASMLAIISVFKISLNPFITVVKSLLVVPN